MGGLPGRGPRPGHARTACCAAVALPRPCPAGDGGAEAATKYSLRGVGRERCGGAGRSTSTRPGRRRWRSGPMMHDAWRPSHRTVLQTNCRFDDAERGLIEFTWLSFGAFALPPPPLLDTRLYRDVAAARAALYGMSPFCPSPSRSATAQGSCRARVYFSLISSPRHQASRARPLPPPIPAELRLRRYQGARRAVGCLLGVGASGGRTGGRRRRARPTTR